MSIVNISIEQNFNQIFVKKKDFPSFEKDLASFIKKWKTIVELFGDRFIYVKESAKENTYFFFQDEGEQIDISSQDYVDNNSFQTNFVRFLRKAEDSEDFFDYSLGLKYKTGLDPFDKSFYSDFFKLTNKFGDISFSVIVTSTDVSGYWDSSYDLVDGDISIQSSYCD